MSKNKYNNNNEDYIKKIVNDQIRQIMQSDNFANRIREIMISEQISDQQQNSPIHKSSTPSPTQPASPQPEPIVVEKFYLKKVGNTMLKECTLKEEPLFKLVNKNVANAEFEYYFSDTSRAKRDFLRRTEFLTTFCDVYGNPSEIRNVETTKRGKLKWNGEYWEVEQKAQLKFV